jgi:hypothetical protein
MAHGTLSDLRTVITFALFVSQAGYQDRFTRMDTLAQGGEWHALVNEQHVREAGRSCGHAVQEASPACCVVLRRVNRSSRPHLRPCYDRRLPAPRIVQF